MNLDDTQILKIIYSAIEDKFGIDTKIIKISDISSLGDYFVITSASSSSQVGAISDSILEKLKNYEIYAKAKEGYNSNLWVILDFNNIIVHILNKENRSYYNLENLWANCPQIDALTL